MRGAIFPTEKEPPPPWIMKGVRGAVRPQGRGLSAMLDQSTERVSQIMNFPTSKQYRIIYLDPPWTYRDKAHAGQRGAEYQYPCMSEADLMDLPIDQISAEDAVMFCWVTWPKLPDALELINWWGFEYKTIGFNWIKRTKHGKLHWGMGNWSRCLAGETQVYLQNRKGIVWIDTLEGIGRYNLENITIWTPTGWRKILDWVCNGPTKVNRIKLKGKEILSSDDHVFPFKIPIKRRVGKWREGNEKRKVEHIIKEGCFDDILKETKRTLVAENGHSVNLLHSTLPVESESPVTEINGFSLSDDLGWLVGLFVAEGNFGSGSCENQIRFSLHAKEQSISDRISEYVDSLQLKGDRYYRKALKTYDFVKGNKRSTYFSKDDMKYLIQCFVIGEGAHHKRLDIDQLLQTKAEFRKALLQGILEGDGHNEENDRWKIGLCNEKLVKDIQVIAESVGLQTSFYVPKPQYKGDTLCHSYALRFLTMNKNRMFDLNGGEVNLDTIEKLEKHVSKAETYDICVEGSYFVANNTVTHNSNSEPCLLATKGKPKRAGKGVHSIITSPLANVLESPIGKHSAKPPEVRDRIVELCGDLPRIELFARERVLGWDSWGNEVEDPFE